MYIVCCTVLCRVGAVVLCVVLHLFVLGVVWFGGCVRWWVLCGCVVCCGCCLVCCVVVLCVLGACCVVGGLCYHISVVCYPTTFNWKAYHIWAYCEGVGANNSLSLLHNTPKSGMPSAKAPFSYNRTNQLICDVFAATSAGPVGGEPTGPFTVLPFYSHSICGEA